MDTLLDDVTSIAVRMRDLKREVERLELRMEKLIEKVREHEKVDESNDNWLALSQIGPV